MIVSAFTLSGSLYLVSDQAGIYALCSLGLRASIVKAFGETNPKGAGAGGLMEQIQQSAAMK